MISAFDKICSIKNNVQRLESLETQRSHPYSGGGGHKKPTLTHDSFSFNSDVSFKGRITERQFSLVNCQTLPCPCCGKIMTKDAQRNSAISEIADSKGEALSNNLKKYSNMARDGRKSAVKELEELALKYPKESLHGLLNKSYDSHIKSLSKKQTNIIDNFFTIFPDANSDEKINEMFTTFFEYQKTLIKYSTREGQFKNKKLKEGLIGMCNSYDLNIRKSKVYDYFEKLPKSTDDKDAFFVKYARRGDYEIAGALLKNNAPTIEHIEPYSINQNNSFSNLLVMCSDCNNERDSTPYSFFIKRHPQMYRNFEIYTSAVNDELKKPKYGEKYENYIKNIKETFAAQTSGDKSHHGPF